MARRYTYRKQQKSRTRIRRGGMRRMLSRAADSLRRAFRLTRGPTRHASPAAAADEAGFARRTRGRTRHASPAAAADEAGFARRNSVHSVREYVPARSMDRYEKPFATGDPRDELNRFVNKNVNFNEWQFKAGEVYYIPIILENAVSIIDDNLPVQQNFLIGRFESAFTIENELFNFKNYSFSSDRNRYPIFIHYDNLRDRMRVYPSPMVEFNSFLYKLADVPILYSDFQALRRKVYDSIPFDVQGHLEEFLDENNTKEFVKLAEREKPLYRRRA